MDIDHARLEAEVAGAGARRRETLCAVTGMHMCIRRVSDSLCTLLSSWRARRSAHHRRRTAAYDLFKLRSRLETGEGDESGGRCERVGGRIDLHVIHPAYSCLHA